MLYFPLDPVLGKALDMITSKHFFLMMILLNANQTSVKDNFHTSFRKLITYFHISSLL